MITTKVIKKLKGLYIRKEDIMGKLFAGISAFLGSIISASSSSACVWIWVDEPETPKSLIK